MKALTFIQPWATLIALGEKQIETRGWYTNYRGPVAIHAGRKLDLEACEQTEIKAALLKHGICSPEELPLGSVIAVSNIFDCVKMVGSTDEKFKAAIPGYKLTYKEYSLGDYRPGRYAWIQAGVKRLSCPVPAKGAQRLWQWEGVA
ncbi:ASCH domain-containing protein [Anaerobacterium chartisolvens]|uniref:ASCH domain-containing protein n=1 Tax=Anaerobacterium chartisolvens TaxID=1297424 RepID=A0A369AKC6_9FIRM|nr:ASCH domain-containing protein [Anaerobacterium chartisolvens]RCX07894.1 ASCH domain-containing protein [Anaerobacterium chartisolvens]